MNKILVSTKGLTPESSQKNCQLVCEQALRGSLVAGREKESLQLRLCNLNSASNYPMTPRRLTCEIFANQRETETNAKCKQTWKNAQRVMTSLVMSSAPISLLHRKNRYRSLHCRDHPFKPWDMSSLQIEFNTLHVMCNLVNCIRECKS